MKKAALVFFALLLAGCATTEPTVKTVRVEVPIATACQPPTLQPTPRPIDLPLTASNAEVIRAALAERAAWRADALACRAVVEGLK